MKIQTLTRGQLIQLYKKLDYGEFKGRVSKYLDITKYDNDNSIIKISQDDIDYLGTNGTYTQKEYVTDLGIVLVNDKSIKVIGNNDILLTPKINYYELSSKYNWDMVGDKLTPTRK